MTPNHPIFFINKWIKPKEVAQPQLMDCQKVYNFILSNGHIAEINGIKCVTLGHELKEAYHPYFGTKKIISDLSKMASYDTGKI